MTTRGFRTRRALCPIFRIAVLSALLFMIPVAAGQSVFCHVTDGAFTVCPDGNLEWSDVTPEFFAESGSYLYADQADLDAVLGTPESPVDTFMLMYDETGRTEPLGPDEYFLVSFTTVEVEDGVEKLEHYVIHIFTDGTIIFIEDGVPQQDENGEIRVEEIEGQRGIVGFGTSPNSDVPHVIAEFQIGLTTAGGNFDGAYSPGPQFWSSDSPEEEGPSLPEIKQDLADLLGSELTPIVRTGIIGIKGVLCSPVPLPFVVAACGPLAAEIMSFSFVSDRITVVEAALRAFDPPDPNFTEVVTPPSFEAFTPTGDSETEIAFASWATSLSEQVSIMDALVTTQDRLGGATLAGEPEFVLLQFQALQNFSVLLADNQSELAQSLQTYIVGLDGIIDPFRDDLIAIQTQVAATGFTDEELQGLLDLGVPVELLPELEQAFVEENIDSPAFIQASQQWVDGINEEFVPAILNAVSSNDFDADGLLDVQELSLGTNPANPDTDSDGMPDGFEVANSCLDPLGDDGSADPDDDGLTNLNEFNIGTDPCLATATGLPDQIGPADGSAVIGIAFAAQYFEAGFSSFDIGVIDDFTLDQGHTITSVEAIIGGFNGYGGMGAIGGYQVNVYSSINAASVSLVGDVVSLNFAFPNSSTPISNPGGLADVVQFDTNFFLGAGTWYLSVIPTNNFGLNGQTAIVTTALGDFNLWQSNPNGGFGFPGPPLNIQTWPINPGYRVVGVTELADSDTDGDGVPDELDNCPGIQNPDQPDSDLNGIGDACQVPGLEHGTAAFLQAGSGGSTIVEPTPLPVEEEPGILEIIVRIVDFRVAAGLTDSAADLTINLVDSLVEVGLVSAEEADELIDDVLAGIDTDGDGIPDGEDICPESELNLTIVIDGCDSGVANMLFDDGCTMTDLIADCADGASNHGDFVSCVAQFTNEWQQQGIISGQEKGAIQSCAAQADIP